MQNEVKHIPSSVGAAYTNQHRRTGSATFSVTSLLCRSLRPQGPSTEVRTELENREGDIFGVKKAFSWGGGGHRSLCHFNGLLGVFHSVFNMDLLVREGMEYPKKATHMDARGIPPKKFWFGPQKGRFPDFPVRASVESPGVVKRGIHHFI